jgi:hypothetical protein
MSKTIFSAEFIEQQKRLASKAIPLPWNGDATGATTQHQAYITAAANHYLDALAEIERLRATLHHIAHYKPADAVDFSWRSEWHYVRGKAKKALEGR